MAGRGGIGSRKPDRSIVALTLLGVVLLASMMVVFTALLDRQRTVAGSVREDAVWAAFQFDREVAKLDHAIERALVSPEAGLIARLRTDFDVLFSRVQILKDGDFAGRFGRSPAVVRELSRASDIVQAIAPRFDALAPGAAAIPELDKLNDIVEGLQPISHEILMTANRLRTEKNVQDREDENRLFWLLALGTIGFSITMGGSIVALTGQLRQLRRAHRALEALSADHQRAAAAAEAGNRAKTEFLATMSHEIRTPLNGLIGTADLLSMSELSGAQRAELDIIRNCGHALLGLISDVLDISKLESGLIELEFRRTSLAMVVDDVVDVVSQTAAQKGVELRAERVDLHVVTDPTRLRQILVNLVGNAVKFTDQGFVEIAVLYIPGSGQPGRCRFEIRDTGVGVPEHARAKLFRDFQQADASVTRRFGGTGLGLAISRRLVEALEGEIGFESEAGKGSTFWFELPARVVDGPSCLPPSPEDVAARADVAQTWGTWQGRRVLLVEDNATNQYVATRLLERVGIRAEVAGHGAEALERATRAEFELVFMDIQMPVMDGLEATRRIRMLDQPHRPIIIGLSANAFETDRDAALAAGMDGFLTKPVTLAKLEGALTRWLGDAPRATRRERPPVSAGAIIDAEQEASLIEALGAEMTGELQRAFVKDGAALLPDLAAAAAKQDDEALRRHLHTIVGAARNVAFTGVAEAALRIREDGLAGRPVDLAPLEAAMAAAWNQIGDEAKQAFAA